MARLRLVSVLAAVAALSLALLVGPAQAEHSWADYHWARTTTSFDLQSVDSVTPDWQFEYTTALSEWSQSSVLNVVDELGSADDGSRTRKRCQPVAGKMRVCNAAYGQNGWLGLAQIWLDGPGHITQGVAKMNDSYSWYWTPDEKRHVMCQEIGHVFGLGHTSEDGTSQKTCMDYSTDPQSTSPNGHDYDQLAAIYGHTDSYDSYAKSESGGGGDGGNDPKPCNPKSPKCNANGVDGHDFGQLVRASEHHQLWMKRGPGGVIVLTHIRLAPR